MKTNDIKNGSVVLLRNGWQATIKDNRKGNTRLALVEGFCTELGSIYSHDIVARRNSENNDWIYDIEYTNDQMKCMKMNRTLFGN